MRAYSWASVAELVDALDSKSSAVRRAGSIPAGGTKPKNDTAGPKLKTRILTEESGFFVVGLGLVGTGLFNAGTGIFGGMPLRITFHISYCRVRVRMSDLTPRFC